MSSSKTSLETPCDDGPPVSAEPVEPAEPDVLCGRGPNCYNHPGNRTFRQLAGELRYLYSIARKGEKLKICQKIAMAIRAQGGRFLQRSTGTRTWYDIGIERSVEKTSKMMRDIPLVKPPAPNRDAYNEAVNYQINRAMNSTVAPFATTRQTPNPGERAEESRAVSDASAKSVATMDAELSDNPSFDSIVPMEDSHLSSDIPTFASVLHRMSNEKKTTLPADRGQDAEGEWSSMRNSTLKQEVVETGLTRQAPQPLPEKTEDEHSLGESLEKKSVEREQSGTEALHRPKRKYQQSDQIVDKDKPKKSKNEGKDGDEDENIVENPNRFDVLVGRGEPNNLHTGNITLRRLVEEELLSFEQAYGSYKSSSRAVKDRLTKNILHKMGKGVRFLTKGGDGKYRSLSEDKVETKIKTCIRDTRLLLLKKNGGESLSPPPAAWNSAQDNQSDHDDDTEGDDASHMARCDDESDKGMPSDASDIGSHDEPTNDSLRDSTAVVQCLESKGGKQPNGDTRLENGSTAANGETSTPFDDYISTVVQSLQELRSQPPAPSPRPVESMARRPSNRAQRQTRSPATNCRESSMNQGVDANKNDKKASMALRKTINFYKCCEDAIRKATCSLHLQRAYALSDAEGKIRILSLIQESCDGGTRDLARAMELSSKTPDKLTLLETVRPLIELSIRDLMTLEGGDERFLRRVGLRLKSADEMIKDDMRSNNIM